VNNNAANLIYAYDSGLSTVGQQFKVNPAESSFGAMLALHEEFAQFLPTPFQAASEGTDADNEARVLLGGTNGQVYMWRPPFIPQGKALLDVAPSPMLLFQCPGLSASDDITSFVMWAGVLFIASDDGTGVKVFSFDGKTITLEDTIASAATGILGAWHGEIYCALNAQAIRQRDGTGTWSSLTFPATVTAFIPRQIIEYGASVYFAGQDGSGGEAVIMAWDGTSLTEARTPNSTRESKLLAMEVSDDKLCYLWDETVGAAAVDFWAQMVLGVVDRGSGEELYHVGQDRADTHATPGWYNHKLLVCAKGDYNRDQLIVQDDGNSPGSIDTETGDGYLLGFDPTVDLHESNVATQAATVASIWSRAPRRSFYGNVVVHGGDALVVFGWRDNAAGDRGILYAWDGSTLTEEATTQRDPVGQDATVPEGTYNVCNPLFILGGDAFYVGTSVSLGVSTTEIFKRASGGGSWSSVLTVVGGAGWNALGGSNSNGHLTGAAVLSGTAYLLRNHDGSGNTAEWYTFDGTSLTYTGTTTRYQSIDSDWRAPPIAFNGYAYYTSADLATRTWHIARHNGTVWEDTHHSLIATASITNFRHPLRVSSYNGSLYVAYNGDLYKSNGTTTTSWSQVDLGGLEVGGKLAGFV
jgi:hypothetical protein